MKKLVLVALASFLFAFGQSFTVIAAEDGGIHPIKDDFQKFQLVAGMLQKSIVKSCIKTASWVKGGYMDDSLKVSFLNLNFSEGKPGALISAECDSVEFYSGFSDLYEMDAQLALQVVTVYRRLALGDKLADCFVRSREASEDFFTCSHPLYEEIKAHKEAFEHLGNEKEAMLYSDLLYGSEEEIMFLTQSRIYFNDIDVLEDKLVSCIVTEDGGIDVDHEGNFNEDFYKCVRDKKLYQIVNDESVYREFRKKLMMLIEERGFLSI